MKQTFTLAAITCCLVLSAAAQEKTPPQKTITVTGTAEAEITPDEIYVQVDLREYDKRGVGKIDIETIKNDFLSACKSIGIADSDVSVQGYGGSDNYFKYRRGSKKDPDLKAGISYWVKLTNTQKMDELVDKLDDEATQNFLIAKTAYSKEIELKKQLKIEAIKAAKAKAEYLTSAIGENIDGALSIVDVELGQAGLYLDNNVSQMNYSVENTNLSRPYFTDITQGNIGFRKIKFQFRVNVVFALK